MRTFYRVDTPKYLFKLSPNFLSNWQETTLIHFVFLKLILSYNELEAFYQCFISMGTKLNAFKYQ